MVIPTFSPDLTNKRAATPYPHVEVLDRSESLALMLSSMERGDLPIVFERSEDKVQIASLHLSAITLCNLLRVTRISVHLSSEESVQVTNVDEVMEVLKKMKGT